MAAFVSASAVAAPFAEWLEHTSPGGAEVRIWGEGDEFSAAFEAEDGHAVLYDGGGRRYVYARRADDGSGALVPTDIAVGDETEADRSALASIPLHLRDTSRAAEEERARRIARQDEETGRRRRWEEVKSASRRRASAAGSMILGAPPSSPTLGTVVGLTVLIDFPDTDDSSGQPTTLARKYSPGITYDVMSDLMNGDDFGMFGNASSVRKYYDDVSLGRLTYTNIVLRGPDRGFFTVSRPRTYYDDTTRADNGPWMKELQSEVLGMIRNSSSYETEYLPLLRQVSSLGGEFRALNLLFAGPSSGVWGRGLWPHMGGLAQEVKDVLPVDVGGVTVKFGAYEFTHIGNTPSIGTLCHENGHMICGFPDLYDYRYGSGGGAGCFSLMGYSGTTHPVCIDAYLRAAAGWVTPKELPAGHCTVTVSNRLDDVWKYTNGADDSQYYLIENRQEKGRDYYLPGGGVLIWRCDEKGSDTNPAKAEPFAEIEPRRTWTEVILEQADGKYGIETRDSADGDRYDPWYRGNPAGGYTAVFRADGIPCARWRDAGRAGIRLSGFSGNGDVMTFEVGDAAHPDAPVVDAAVVSGEDYAKVAASAKSLGTPAGGYFVYADVSSVNPSGTATNSYRMLVGRLRHGVTKVERTVTGLTVGWTHIVRVSYAPDTGGVETVLVPGVKVLFNTNQALSYAVDASDVPFWNSGASNMADWSVRGAGEAKKGYICIRAGEKSNPGAGGISEVNAMVRGPGKFSFWWRTSTPADGFVLACWRKDEGADGNAYVGEITGETEWRQVSVRVPSGNSTFNWYFWDVAGYAGDAYAWLDCVEWEPDDKMPPSAPRSASATQGTLTNGVMLTWAEAPGARRYRVWRTDSGSSETVLVGEAEECRFLDDFAVGGRVYAYSVEPQNLAGSGEPSAQVYGWTPATLAVETTDFGSCPVGEVGSWQFSATGGRRPYSWSVKSSSDIPQGTAFDEATGTLYGAPLASGRYIVNVSVTDANGMVAQGGASLLVLGPPASTEFNSITRSDGYNRIAWRSVSNASRYIVYRSARNDFSTAEVIADAVTGISYVDASSGADQTFWYWVVCANEYGESAACAPVSSRDIDAPGVYYVDGINGNNGNDGTSAANAVPTIGRALLLADSRKCTIKVAPGTYSNFSTRDAPVTIEATEGPEVTFISGNGLRRCATLSEDGKGTNTVLVGFTLLDGVASDGKGGGALGGVLERCVVSNCTAVSASGPAFGGGVFGSVLDNCLVVSNAAVASAASFRASGGGAYGATMYNCTLSRNVARAADVTLACGAGAADGAAFNTIAWENSIEGGGESVAAPGVNAVGVKLHACCTQDDPVFCRENPRPWRLASSSPCVYAADVSCFRRRWGNDLAGDWMGSQLGCYTKTVTPTATSLQPVEGLRGRYDADRGGAVLRWRADPKAETYRVYRGNSRSTSSARLVAEVSRAMYFDEGAVEDVTYWYRVIPANAKMSSYTLTDSTPCLELDSSSDVADLYVSRSRGDDENNGRGRDAPLATLQAAADKADAGDVVLVSSGQYNPFNSWGTTFSMLAEAGPGSTWITGRKRTRCATLAMTMDREATNTVLTGFTIMRGKAGAEFGYVGGGVLGGTLNNCIVHTCVAGDSDATADAMGGGVAYCVLNGCEVYECESVSAGGAARGGGAACSTLRGCLVRDNAANVRNSAFAAYGGGVYGSYAYDSEITGNAAANSRSSGGGRAYGGGMYGYEAERSSIWGNSCETWPDAAEEPITVLRECSASPGQGGSSGGTAAPLSVTTRSLPGGAPGDAYSATLEASGGVAPYRWTASVASGAAYAETSEEATDMPGGAAQYWQADDGSWSRELPFDFPFFGVVRRTVWVNSNGHISFDGAYGSMSYRADEAGLKSHAMVAALWTDLKTVNGNIYTAFSESEATIRWDGAYYSGSSAAKFSVTLKPDGTIRCRYGEGNAKGGMIGISAGDGVNYLLSAKSGGGSMSGAADIVFAPLRSFPPGLALSSEGVLSGVPRSAGTWILDVIAADDAGSSAAASLMLVVDPGLFYTTQSPVPVSYSWLKSHPSLLSAPGVAGDYEAAAKTSTGKYDTSGDSLNAWYDYLVGTDPEDIDDLFTATIEMVDGSPVVGWTPDLNEGGKLNARRYIVEGKTNLTDKAWHSPTNEASRFFRVRVEMP